MEFPAKLKFNRKSLFECCGSYTVVGSIYLRKLCAESLNVVSETFIVLLADQEYGVFSLLYLLVHKEGLKKFLT